ncbi:dioxygenase [Limosilactobacillus vaginalis]|uniref:dioxygenase n=1 Tax=Limosilactobacillus vaginalis TaxID=1633 RepID=UPI00265D92E8|nr:dioxygenase [Limosilactobacillus vaginalis]
MADNIKQAVIETDAYDEVLFSAEPKYYRSLPGELPNRLVQLTDEGKSKKEVWRAANAYRRMHDGMIDGDLNKGYASFGLGISFIHQIDPIDKVVDRIYSGYRKNNDNRIS